MPYSREQIEKMSSAEMAYRMRNEAGFQAEVEKSLGSDIEIPVSQSSGDVRNNIQRAAFRKQDAETKKALDRKQAEAVREAQAGFATVAGQQAEEFRHIVGEEALTEDYLKQVGFILGSATQKQIDAAIEAFKYSTPAFDYRNAQEVATLSGFFTRNDNINNGITSNLQRAFSLLVEWGLLTPIEPPVPVPVQEPPAGPTPSEQAEQNRQKYFNEVVVKHPVTGVGYTEYTLSLLPSKEELYLRRIAEKGHSGSQLVDDFWEAQNIIAAKQATLNAEIPQHPSAAGN